MMCFRLLAHAGTLIGYVNFPFFLGLSLAQDPGYFSKGFSLAIAVFIRHRGWSLLEEGNRTKRSCLWSKR
ncbi:uncharacterized protein BDW43DRAFT_264003 [Aspergillus alliaceus]|uniref:uncharacterized protein n=1 Tax=Petromyces alliaceus TaxID=209559 RepID=UPI0012A426DB|nr:uncharacterized protein BDW43DRAFT_264003 [Aspergillus alliaceus]KAB8237707.1 hypothetical protein BDW43DRAFT_264003 [Aspergillus alliaceus]